MEFYDEFTQPQDSTTGTITSDGSFGPLMNRLLQVTGGSNTTGAVNFGEFQMTSMTESGGFTAASIFTYTTTTGPVDFSYLAAIVLNNVVPSNGVSGNIEFIFIPSSGSPGGAVASIPSSTSNVILPLSNIGVDLTQVKSIQLTITFFLGMGSNPLNLTISSISSQLPFFDNFTITQEINTPAVMTNTSFGPFTTRSFTGTSGTLASVALNGVLSLKVCSVPSVPAVITLTYTTPGSTVDLSNLSTISIVNLTPASSSLSGTVQLTFTNATDDDNIFQQIPPYGTIVFQLSRFTIDRTQINSVSVSFNIGTFVPFQVSSLSSS